MVYKVNVVFKGRWVRRVSALLELMVLPVHLGSRLLVGGDLRDLRAPVEHKVQRGQLEKKESEDQQAQQDPEDPKGQ